MVVRSRIVLTFSALAIFASAGRAAGQSLLGPIARTPMTTAQESALAVSAAPDTIARGAGVFVFGSNGYTRVRSSSNGFECLVNRDSFLDGYDALKPTCYDREGVQTILPVLLRIGSLIGAAGATPQTIRADIGRGYASGELKAPSRAGVAYMLQGDVAEYDAATGKVLKHAFPPHMMIYAPGITQQDLGITDAVAEADPRLPLIYSRGPQFGYIVVRVPQAGPASAGSMKH